jgi:hypothetical protein
VLRRDHIIKITQTIFETSLKRTQGFVLRRQNIIRPISLFLRLRANELKDGAEERQLIKLITNDKLYNTNPMIGYTYNTNPNARSLITNPKV